MPLEIKDEFYISIVRPSAAPGEWFWSVKRPFGEPGGSFGWAFTREFAEHLAARAMEHVYSGMTHADH